MTAFILADTGPLYALADSSDQYHKRAHAGLDGITARGYRVAVSYPVLCESHTLVLRRLGGDYARRWLDEILDGADLVNPEPGDYLAAASLLGRFPDHPITLTDAVTAVLSQRLRVAIWSFDQHFAIIGTKQWRQP